VSGGKNVAPPDTKFSDMSDRRSDVVILACALSAGIHGALVPEHLEEATAAGVGFVAATVLLGALAVALTRDASRCVLLVAASVFAGLIASYVLVVVGGLPVLHPEQEAVDSLAVVTKAVETLGFVVAATLVRRPSPAPVLNPKGTTT